MTGGHKEMTGGHEEMTERTLRSDWTLRGN